MGLRLKGCHPQALPRGTSILERIVCRGLVSSPYGSCRMNLQAFHASLISFWRGLYHSATLYSIQFIYCIDCLVCIKYFACFFNKRCNGAGRQKMDKEQIEKNRAFIRTLKGGVIMDVTTPEEAKIAEDAGAVAVMALERVPADIRAAGGVARMSDPGMIIKIKESVSIPVMAKCRIGHIAEARILESIGIDCIDESEVLSPADDAMHVDKHAFKTPFVCGARDLGEALRRISEGAAMMRTKGEAGTGDVVQAVRHMRKINADIRRVASLRSDELYEAAKTIGVSVEELRYVHENGCLPVANFSAGGVATPADAALMMELGAEGVFVGSGIFRSGDPVKRAAAIVKAVANWKDANILAEVSTGLGKAMVGINADEIKLIMEERGR